MSNILEERKKLAQEIFADLEDNEYTLPSKASTIELATTEEFQEEVLINDLKEGKAFLLKIIKFVRPYLRVFGKKCKEKIEKFFAAFDILFPDV